MTDKFIFNGRELIDNSIVIGCQKAWSQDDFSALISDFFSQFPDLLLKEVIYGADRVEVSLNWQTTYLTLNIESYSESIWLESSDEPSALMMKDVFLLMSK